MLRVRTDPTSPKRSAGISPVNDPRGYGTESDGGT